MTRSSQPTKSQPGSNPKLEHYVLAARAVLAFERIWPRLWPASGIAGIFLALALFGVLPLLPWTLHALILAAFVTAISLLLYFNLNDFSWPHWRDGARKLERDSDLAHRPISEAGDTLAAGLGDVYAEELWRAHLRQRLSHLGRFRLSLPVSDLPKRDPKALRFAVLLLIGFGAFAAGPNWSQRIFAALGPAAGTSAGLDAWIDPPLYTGEAPIYLTQKNQASLPVPVGSVLNVRVHGADHIPYLSLSGAHFEGGDGEYAGRAVILEDGRVRVRADGRTLGSWRITAIPDRKPVIAFAAPPAGTDRDALKISYKASDDYGVTGARALIRPHGKEGDTLIVDLQLPERSAKAALQTIYRDLTGHPYAGLDVDITLEATDGAGQTSTSATVRFKLPARVFSDPLARALIEQRQTLATLGLAGRGRTLRTLDALAIAPDKFYAGQTATYLALRSTYWGLKYAASKADLSRIEDLLWQSAVSLEHGGLLTMAEQLRRMQQALTRMMAEGAPQDAIENLLARYNALMQRYLQTLAQNAPQGASPADPNAKMLGEQDLATLLRAIEVLSQSGDRFKAAQLLALLQSLIENVHVSNGPGGAGSGAENEALRGLGELMGKQRMLLDKTFRQSQGAGDPKDGGSKGLAHQQGQLQGELDALLKKQKKPQSDLDRAGKLMGDAGRALELGDLPRAGTLQKYVLDALRKGAGALAGNLARQGKNADANSDPLGRLTGRGAGMGGDLQIPDASVLQHARDILKELRKRAGEQGRPKDERDYIDRLLKQF